MLFLGVIYEADVAVVFSRPDRNNSNERWKENNKIFFFFCRAKAKYQISRDEQKLRVENEIHAMENVDLDDEAKMKE